MAPAEATDARRCGFIALIGAPNVGKSTIVNALVGQKVAIVSPKAQTTRTRLMGVAMEGDTQIVLIDTPGIFAPKRRLDRAMVAAAWSGAADADLAVLIVDASRKSRDPDTDAIIAGLKQQNRKAILVLNKIDIVQREKLLAQAASFNAEGIFTDIFIISAETGDGVDDLMNALAQRMPEGPHHYPDDQVTDAPMRLLAAEITREHLFRQLHQEVPYALTVEPETWEDFQDGSVRISQVIYVERANQKPIVLGKGGQRIKAVREAAQAEIQQLLDRKVHLFLHVTVREKWADDRAHYKDLGLDYDA